MARYEKDDPALSEIVDELETSEWVREVIDESLDTAMRYARLIQKLKTLKMKVKIEDQSVIEEAIEALQSHCQSQPSKAEKGLTEPWEIE